MTKTLPEGLHTRFEHCRNYRTGNLRGGEILPLDPRGGTTICYLEDEENNVLSRGYATCSKTEQYNKRIGRLISQGRALKSYEAGDVLCK